ncbi:rhodanese-like domain-containing protein [Candidatus Bathyarchaeota archaeon]|nr:MAG: rhodanese-like domain-containing protein [Candidatus Bathyarchaeota archaeon]
MVSKRTSIIVLVIVAILAVTAGIYTPKLLNMGNDYGDVTVQEAKKLIEDEPELVILDVRTDAEYNDGHIEGATNFPVEELANRLTELDKNSELLVYCRTGNRSSTAVSILEDAGFSKIYHMSEGISAWTQQGYPIVQ